MNRGTFTFPVGYFNFNSRQVFNFQLNRWYSLGYARYEDMQEAGKKISTFVDWRVETLRLAEAAVAEGRLMNAAFYYRAAEFYTLPQSPDKELFYNKFIDLFYRVFQKDGIQLHRVPYENTSLPAIKLSPIEKDRKGTIIIHGGFDSFIEEFYSWMTYFTERGYDVIAFEGPGQGAAIKKFGLPLIYQWEKPTGAVLDHFKLENVTLIGISMGGYLCIRAAAYEPRIQRVIASSVVFDYMQMPSPPLQWISKSMLPFTGVMNFMADIKMKNDPMHNWSVHNAMHITRTGSPADAMQTFLQFNERNLHSELVRQDALLLTGKEDHFIPFKMHEKQMNALINARSVTGRVFTREEQAQNHCQIGNIGLALDVMAKWIDEKSLAVSLKK
jgi:pimeloyl-ACP methyl ester carboxylesterase